MKGFQGAIIIYYLPPWKKDQSSRGFGFTTESESRDALTNDSSEEVPANYLLPMTIERQNKIEGAENTVFPTAGYNTFKNIQSKPHSKCATCKEFLCINEKCNYGALLLTAPVHSCLD
ncbi:hypothetical protein TNCV_505671 [Trichonephila clavipes]|nr:hypothetical protein TNCV_505671 [Trichonephila clavipes]